MNENEMPNLSFGWSENKEHNYENPNIFRSEYDIFCRNNDQKSFQLTRICLRDGMNTIYDCNIDVADEFVIPAQGNRCRYIKDAEFSKIKKYCNDHNINECIITVYIDYNDYSYKIDMSKMRKEASFLKRNL